MDAGNTISNARQILQLQLEKDPYITNIDLADATTGAPVEDEIGVDASLSTYLTGTSAYDTESNYDYQVSLLDRDLDYVVSPSVSANIEVGAGGTATIVGGTGSTLYLWHEKNVIWENNGTGNSIDFAQEIGSGQGGPTGALVLDLLTGQGESQFGGSLQVSGVDTIVTNFALGEYIVANNDGDVVESMFAGNAVIIGGSGDDILDGSQNGSNLIVAGSGDSTLFGGTATDVFVYNRGIDTIGEFTAGTNEVFVGARSILDLTSLQSITSLAQVMAHATQVGSDTVLVFGAGETITLQDVTASSLTSANFAFTPIIAFANAPSGLETAGDMVAITLAVSDAVTVSTLHGTPTLSLNDGGTAFYDAADSDPAGHLLVFDYTVGANDQTTSLAITGGSLNGGAITASGGQELNFGNAAGQTFDLQIGMPLTVSSISYSGTGEVDIGQTLQITLRLNEAVDVALGGTLYGESATVFGLQLNDDAIAEYNAGLSNPASGQLVFTDVVAAADHTPHLAIEGVLGLTPASGLADVTTVEDSNGYAASFADAIGAASGISVNAPLYVASLSTDAAASPTGYGTETDSGQTFQITLSLNEAVTVSGGAPTLALSDGGTASYDAAASAPASGELVFDGTVSTAQHSPSLEITAVNPNGATIKDAGGQSANFASAIGQRIGAGLEVNPSPLSVTGVAATTSVTDGVESATIALTLSEPVSNANPILLSEGSNIFLVLNNGDFAEYDGASGNQLIYYDLTGTDDANISVAAIDNTPFGTLATPFVDANGYIANLSGALNVNTGVSLQDPLYVLGVSSNAASGESQGGQPILISVAMSEAVTLSGAAPSLSLSDGGTANYDAAASTLASGTLVFSYTPPASEEVSSLNIASFNDTGNITDARGNAADLGLAIGAPLQLQIGPSTVLTAASTEVGDLTQSDTTSLLLVMSQNVLIDTAGGTPTLTLSNGGVATYDAAATADTASDGSTSVGQIVFDYTVGPGQATPDLAIDRLSLNGAVITDTVSGQNADFSALDTPYLGVEVECFVEGTKITTARGAVVVEALAVGDTVRTLGAGGRKIKWIGQRSYDGRFIAGHHLALPVRIAPHAIAPKIPRRDLVVSPGHGIYIDGALVPAWRLINGVSITQARHVDIVTYFHIELENHAVIFAEGCPAESYLDIGDRAQFQNAHGYNSGDYAQGAALPRLEDGFSLLKIQRRINARAGIAVASEKRGAMRGYVDIAGQNGVVAGWAQDQANLETPVSLDIFMGETLAGRVLANRYRADLRMAGLGTGCHAFEIALPIVNSGDIRVARTADGAGLARAAPQAGRAA